MDKFIIEHPRKGTFREMDHGVVPSDEVKARFSLTGARNDPLKTRIFTSLADVTAALYEIPSHVRNECNILVYNPYNQTYYKLVKV